MILFFTDRRLNIVGQASTHLPKGLKIVDDLKTEDVETGVAVLECTLSYSNMTKDERKRVSECATVGNYILRQTGDKDKVDEFYTIIESEEDTKAQEIHIYAEDAGLDLLNEIVGAYEAPEAKPISFYINQFAYDTGFGIGINEVENLTRQLSWDGTATITERLASVATQFDNCELSFSFKLDGFKIKNKFINIHKRRGKDISDVVRLNKEVDSIVTTKSIANLATALRVTGGTPEPEEPAEGEEYVEPVPVTLDGYKYDDGDFFLEGTYLKSRKAVEIWSRYLAESGDYTGHICKRFEYDTIDQAELCNRAIAELKKLREVEVNYEIDISRLPESAKLGDRINIVDDDGELYLSARILKLEISESQNVRKATLGEYLIKSGGISQKIMDLSEKFSASAQETVKALNAAKAAQKEAESAKNTADTAKDVAESVDEKATTALNAANEAKNSVESAVNAAGEASGKAEAVRQDLEQAQNDIAGFKKGLEAIEETMSAEYTRKSELTEVTADLESKITKSAAEITTSVSATYATKTELNKKEDGYSIEIYNGTGGNPKPVKFATVNYSSCNSENGVAIKISMVSGHGNGTSYSFLQDATIRVNHIGGVEVDNVKHYGAETPTYDGEIRQYGDIFWVIDTTSKVVDFYCLMGQYARVYQTPWKRLTYSTGGTVTQYTTCTVYSSGDKVWANNSDIALMSDIVELSTRITQTESDITLRATKTELAAVDTKATNAGNAAATAQSTANGVVDNLANNYYTKTQTEAKIKVEADKIESVVQTTNDHGTRLSKVEQTADGLTISLGQTNENVTKAQGTADEAKTSASNAATAASNAATAAANAKTAADNAQGTANTANSTANTAKTNAATAQSTADTAKSNAATAQATADNAASAAATAQSTANTANTNATNAAKTATNFLEYTSGGLVVGNKSNGSWSGYRTRMTSSTFEILDASGNILSSYGANNVYIGKNNANATIDFCNGRATLGYNSSKGFTEFYSPNGFLINGGVLMNEDYSDGTYTYNAVLGTNRNSTLIRNTTYQGDAVTQNSYVSLGSGANDLYGSSRIRLTAPTIALEGGVGVDGTVDSNGSITIDPGSTNYTPFVSKRKISSATYQADFGVGNPATGVASAMMRVLNSSGTALNNLHLCDTYLGISDGYMEAPSGFRMPNNTHLYSYTVGGALWSLVTLSVDNNVVFGWGSYNGSSASSRLYGNNVYLTSKSKVYSSVAVTVSSDRRIKEDVSEEYGKFDALLDHLKPVSYKLKTTNDGRKHLGLIAQDVEQAMQAAGLKSDEFALVTRADVDPETDPDKLLDDGFCLGIAYEELIPILIHRVQRLNTEIEKLKGMILA